ncbi:hypothetical protein CC80DRAFT_543022 [Byssothecium circinans]|uniref:Uncharacterized protein n=1 Tax=Byssothecium circinans TaxID=147558 RepID=A0A6A5UCJ3_9PLEO|nr:hypothetical protein CC80DRAFT_543022 [Byssothecium circinans]
MGQEEIEASQLRKARARARELLIEQLTKSNFDLKKPPKDEAEAKARDDIGIWYFLGKWVQGSIFSHLDTSLERGGFGRQLYPHPDPTSAYSNIPYGGGQPSYQAFGAQYSASSHQQGGITTMERGAIGLSGNLRQGWGGQMSQFAENPGRARAGQQAPFAGFQSSAAGSQRQAGGSSPQAAEAYDNRDDNSDLYRSPTPEQRERRRASAGSARSAGGSRAQSSAPGTPQEDLMAYQSTPAPGGSGVGSRAQSASGSSPGSAMDYESIRGPGSSVEGFAGSCASSTASNSQGRGTPSFLEQLNDFSNANLARTPNLLISPSPQGSTRTSVRGNTPKRDGTSSPGSSEDHGNSDFVNRLTNWSDQKQALTPNFAGPPSPQAGRRTSRRGSSQGGCKDEDPFSAQDPRRDGGAGGGAGGAGGNNSGQTGSSYLGVGSAGNSGNRQTGSNRSGNSGGGGQQYRSGNEAQRSALSSKAKGTTEESLRKKPVKSRVEKIKASASAKKSPNGSPSALKAAQVSGKKPTSTSATAKDLERGLKDFNITSPWASTEKAFNFFQVGFEAGRRKRGEGSQSISA